MRLILFLVAACPVVAVAADQVKPLDVKLGLWESKMTNQSSGMLGLPPEMLARSF